MFRLRPKALFLKKYLNKIATETYNIRNIHYSIFACNIFQEYDS